VSQSLQQWAGVGEGDPRTILAVLFTDIIDSTTLARTVGDRTMFEMLVKHFEAARLERFVVEFDSFEIKIIGDAYMAAFRTADAALQFALSFRADTGDPRIAIRVGIHVGPVRIKDNDIYGLMVNYAARLSHVQVPGDEGIFLSDAAKTNIESEYGNTQKHFRLRPLAETTLKGFPPGERVWQVITPEIQKAREKRLAAQTALKMKAQVTSAMNQASSSILTPTENPTRKFGLRRRYLVQGRPKETIDPRKK